MAQRGMSRSSWRSSRSTAGVAAPRLGDGDNWGVGAASAWSTSAISGELESESEEDDESPETPDFANGLSDNDEELGDLSPNAPAAAAATLGGQSACVCRAAIPPVCVTVFWS